MISKTPSTTLEDFLATLVLTDETRKRCRRSVASYSDILGRSPLIDDLSNESLVALPDQLSAVNVSASVVATTISYLRLIWREAYHRGLTLELPPAPGTSHRPHERATRNPRKPYVAGLRAPIAEPPPACLALDSPLLDVALHMAHAKQADCVPKTREHYRGSVRRFELYLERESTGHDLTDANLETLREWMQERRFSFFTCRNTRWNLRALWHHLHHEGIRDDVPENPRPVYHAPEPAEDITSVLAAHKAANEREARKPPSSSKPVLATIGGMLRRLVSPAGKPPLIVPAEPPAPDRDPATITIAELIAAWRQAAKGVQLASEIGNVNIALRPLEAFFGHELVKDFGPKKLKAMREKSVEGYTIGQREFKGLSRQGVNARVSRVRRVFKWGVSEELAPAELYHALSAVMPLQFGRTTARELPRVKPVDDSVVDATLPHLPPVVRDMVQFQRLTSCRPGEVCIVRPCDVERTGDVWVYRPAKHKTQYAGKVRTIYIGPKAQLILAPYLEREPELYCFSPRESELWRRNKQRLARKTPVQPSQVDRSKASPKKQPGQVYLRNEYARAIRQTCKAHDIPPWHLNQLRHSGATKIRKEFGIEGAQVILGHSRADVTQVYAERNEEIGVDVMRRIG